MSLSTRLKITKQVHVMNTLENLTLYKEKWGIRGIHYFSLFGSKTFVGTR